MPSSICLRRLRVLRQGKVAYDQPFHTGVNIIRGENGSGKSTISDFIFYALGGEFNSWKKAAGLCDEVQAEILTPSGALTIRREIGSKTTAPAIFFAPLEEANRHASDGWQSHPLHRTDSRDSFSQILFRAAEIPEAQSQGSSNITMHQILRLAYSDQRTPTGKLFRFEQWDTRDIREAVGNLVCGLNVYEAYDIQLRLRELGKQFDVLDQELRLRLAAFPEDERLSTLEAINARLKELASERQKILTQIEGVDEFVAPEATEEFLTERKAAVQLLGQAREKLKKTEQDVERTNLEVTDLDSFLVFLGNLAETLPNTEAASEIVGNIQFTHCPSCLAVLATTADKTKCVVCGQRVDPDLQELKYLQIRIDIDSQLKESRELHSDKVKNLENLRGDLRRQQREYQEQLAMFAARFDLSSSPRESYLAERNMRLGQLEREARYLSRLTDIAREVSQLSEQKAEVQRQIQRLKDRQGALGIQNDKRRRQALTLISLTTKEILQRDLPRQAEFANPNTVKVDFGDDAISVDDLMNFAESSNVVLKNSAILGLLFAATQDDNFFHPRFILLDNVEDKGMEVARSHNFQTIVMNLSQKAKLGHQIIFTTSMMNPELELEEYVIGPSYTHERRALTIS